MKSYSRPPATLGSTAAAGARIVVWCRACRHRVEPDPGHARLGGRVKGTRNKLDKTAKIAIVKQREAGLTPLEYMLAVLRDTQETKERRAWAATTAAPFIHPRLHAIDAKIETALVVMTEDERRQRARRAILEAFAERPVKLIEGEVIEVDAAEMLGTEAERVGQIAGRVSRDEANPLEDIEE
jgi:hypothetical protein